MKIIDLPVYFEDTTAPIPFQLGRIGEKVWINGFNGLLGRYSSLGVDIHTKEGQCIGCKAGKKPNFDDFVQGMLDTHGINLKVIAAQFKEQQVDL